MGPPRPEAAPLPGAAPPADAAPAPRRASAAPPGSLFSEMLDWMLAPFLLVWPLSVGVTYLIGVSLADDAFDRTLAAQARALADQVVHDGNGYRLAVRREVLLPGGDGDSHFYRLDSVNAQTQLGDPELPALPAAQVPADGSAVFHSAAFGEQAIRVATLRLPATGASPLPEPLILSVAETTTRRERLAREIMRGIVTPQFVVVPLMVMLMWMGLRRGTAPLERLRAAVTSRRADDLSPLSARDAPEEVAPLVNAFNDLLARVAREGEAQRRFIANAAHQLRTPLAGIRMQAELALREGGGEAALAQIAAGTARTAHLVNQLLALARSEGAPPAPDAAVDLTAAVREAVAAAYPQARDKDIALVFEGDPPVPVTGSADLLRELAANLVDNAVRYTPAGGHVTVRMHAAPPGFAVDDDGPGIPPAERALVFERFYRVLGSAETGSGLGLAIVREIASRHGAAVAVDEGPGGRGCRFTVSFKA